MKAITEPQPHASLIVHGIQTIVSKSWQAPESLVGQRIAIHAAAKPPTGGMRLGGWEVSMSLASVIDFGGTKPARVLPTPLGAVVGSAVLTACIPMVTDDRAHGPLPLLAIGVYGSLGLYPGDDPPAWWKLRSPSVADQLPYGEFTPGRWAWLLADAQPTTELCPWCLGTGVEGLGDEDDIRDWCPMCAARGVCYPIRAKGRSRVWEWTL